MMSRDASLWFAVAGVFVLAIAADCQTADCQTADFSTANELAPLRFEDVAEQAGIDFLHTDGGSGRRYVIESMTAGCAILDYDGDGLQDIYFVNGSPLPGNNSEPQSRNTLYRNLGNWRFEDVTDASGVGDTGYGLGVTSADYDNDGDADLYISNYGPNVLYRNNGDGTFSDSTEWSMTSGGQRFGAGAVFLDMDADGNLDLYCANYQKFKFDQHFIRKIAGYEFHPGPADFPPDEDLLFRNLGNGQFVDVSQESGIAAVAGTGMGVIATDIDNDGDADVLVANDSLPNFLFVNDGSGNFSEQAVLAGLAFDGRGEANGNMGVDCGDADGDGLLDIITTTYQGEMPVLYQNLGSGVFADVTNLSRLPRSLFPHVNWGVGMADLDNDADQDIYLACGHFMDNIAFVDDRTTMKVRNYLLRNDGSGQLADVSESAGSGLSIMESSRGTAIDDLDGDGDLDVVAVNFNAAPSVLRNQSDSGNWLRIKLIGKLANRDGVGSRVTVVANGREQVAEVYAGRGYQSAYGATLHFGLGRDKPSSVKVQVDWAGSNQTQLWSVDANKLFILQEKTE